MIFVVFFSFARQIRLWPLLSSHWMQYDLSYWQRKTGKVRFSAVLILYKLRFLLIFRWCSFTAAISIFLQTKFTTSTWHNNEILASPRSSVEGEINARQIITPLEFVESNCENIIETSLAFSCCEYRVTSTNYQCHLQTVEVCLSTLQELE